MIPGNTDPRPRSSMEDQPTLDNLLADFDSEIKLTPGNRIRVLTNFGSVTKDPHNDKLLISGVVGYRQILESLKLLDCLGMQNALSFMERFARPRITQTLYEGGLFGRDGFLLASPGDTLFDLAKNYVSNFHIQRISLHRTPPSDIDIRTLRNKVISKTGLRPPEIYYIGEGGMIDHLTINPYLRTNTHATLMLRGDNVSTKEGYFGNANDGNLGLVNTTLINPVIKGIINDLKGLPEPIEGYHPINLANLVRSIIYDDLVDSIRQSYYPQDIV